MATNDKDYKLNHEQLIKVCKILLHICNSTNTKLVNTRDNLRAEFDDKLRLAEESTRSQMEEVSQLVHSIHQDFEAYLKKSRQEHQELTLKLSKL